MLFGDINFNSAEWAAIERWLSETREKKVSSLLSADSWDTSLKYRGSIAMIDEMLRLKKAALDARVSR